MVTALRQLATRHRRFLTFCAVGASGVVVNLGVFSAALLGLEPAIGQGWLTDNLAVLLGWLVSVASNFALNDRLTFRASEGYARGWRRRIASYYTSAFAAFIIQWLMFNGLMWGLESALAEPLRQVAHGTGSVAWLLATALHFRRAASNLVGIGVATIANYLLAKHWVFRASDVDAEG